MQILPISKKGFEKATAKLAEVKREFETLPAIIKIAREKGDLKENAEYHAARERQGMLNAEIQHITSQITQSQILNPSQFNKDAVTFGKSVEIENIETKEISYHTLVGPAETSYWQNALSVTTTVARALMGKKINDIVTATTPSGEKKYRVLSIKVME